jgi:hypothetical protein
MHHLLALYIQIQESHSANPEADLSYQKRETSTVSMSIEVEIVLSTIQDF